MSLQDCTKGMHAMRKILEYDVNGLYSRVIKLCSKCKIITIDTDYGQSPTSKHCRLTENRIYHSY
jgi:hypothetical protein